MRNYVLAITVGLGLAAAASLAVLDSPLRDIASNTPSAAVVALPPPPTAAPAPPPAALPPVSPPPAPPAVTEAPPTPAPAAPALPTVVVPSHPVHSVPDNEPPAPAVTPLDRKSRTIKEIKPSNPAAAASGAPSVPVESTALARPPRPRPAPLSMPVTFNGAARAAGPTLLAVGGQEVRLFGVKVADRSDRCGLGTGDNRSCADVARDALAQRLQRYPGVTCHVPPGQSGTPAAVCSDASGTDLGGFLVAAGYALADTTQSYDYYGAQGVARSFRRGLWRYR